MCMLLKWHYCVYLAKMCVLFERPGSHNLFLFVQWGWNPFAISSMTLMNFSSSSWELCVQASGRWVDTILRSTMWQKKLLMKNERGELYYAKRKSEIFVLKNYPNLHFFPYFSPFCPHSALRNTFSFIK